MAAVIESWFRQDLQKPVQVHYLDGSLFSNNGNGNRIGVELTNGGEDYTVTGTVSGYAVLADGSTVPCTGAKSGNKASILVPPAAYLPGNIFITIFLTDGTTVTTLAAVSSTVIQARTDNQVSPGSVVTDWTNTINAAMQSVETSAANLGKIVATPYAQLTFPVPLGKYTYYNNNLYRCTTPIPSSEDFTAAHWSSALNLGDEVSDLKSAIDDVATNESVPETAGKTSSIFTQYGTAGYVSYTDGHFVATDTNVIYLYDITADDTISITPLGGTVGAVLYDEHLDSIPTGSSAASAHYVKGARSDKTGDYALPSSESPWSVTAGQMLAIFIQTAAQTNNFVMGYHSTKLVFGAVEFNDDQIAEIDEIATGKNPTIKYLSTVDTDIGSVGKEQISIFLPSKKGYIKYAFVRCEYDPKNANTWRIDRCYSCDDNKSVLFPITNVGEWEMAIKIDGAPDFIGGNAHGDEVFTSFHVLIDGVEISNVSSITEQTFEEVRIVETSLMYNPSDEATLSTRSQYTPVGTHGREYIINKNGIRLKQEVTLDTALTLSASYMTMLPILRGNDTASAAQITDHYFADNNFVEYDVSVGGSGSGYGWKRNVTMATIWGNTSGICATVEMLKQPEIDNSGARMFQVQSTVNSYNKLYWSICGVDNADYSASANERFVTDTMFMITAKNMS